MLYFSVMQRQFTDRIRATRAIYTSLIESMWSEFPVYMPRKVAN